MKLIGGEPVTETIRNGFPSPLPRLNSYEFIPRIVGSDKVVVGIYRSGNAIVDFEFTGSQLSSVGSLTSSVAGITNDFHYTSNTSSKIYSLQAKDSGEPTLFGGKPYADEGTTTVTIHENNRDFSFNHPFVHELLGKLTAGNLDSLFDYYLKNVPDLADAFGADQSIYNEL